MSETIAIDSEKVGRGRKGPAILSTFTPGAGFQKLAALATQVLGTPQLTAPTEIDTLQELLRVGKEHGVLELNLVLSNDVGLDVGAELSVSGVPVKAQCKLGTKGEKVIAVKYK